MITELSTPSMTPEGGGKNNTGLIVLGVILTLGIGYYFLVHKPAQEEKAKQQGQ